MQGKRLAKRILLTLALIAGFFHLLFAPLAQATPIRPDLQKLMSPGPEANIHFAPARAGWQGPEMSPAPARAAVGESLLDTSESAQRMREALVAVALPDLRVVVLIVLAIFLMRHLRRRASLPLPQAVPMRQPVTLNCPPVSEERPPAKAA